MTAEVMKYLKTKPTNQKKTNKKKTTNKLQFVFSFYLVFHYYTK